jgi:hypothetical protein
LHPQMDIEIFTRNSDRDPLSWFSARLLVWRGGDTYNIRYTGDPEDDPPNEFDGQIDPWRQRASVATGDHLLIPLSATQSTHSSSKKRKRKDGEEDVWVSARVVKTNTPTSAVVRLVDSSRDIKLDTRTGTWRMDASKNTRKRRRGR